MGIHSWTSHEKSPTSEKSEGTTVLHQQNIHVVSCPVLANEQGMLPPGVCSSGCCAEPTVGVFLVGLFSWNLRARFWSSVSSSVCEFTFSGVDEIKLSHKLTYLRKAHLHLTRPAATQRLCTYRFTGFGGLSPEKSLCTLLPYFFQILKFFKEYSENPASAQLPDLHRFPLQTTEGNRLLVKVTGMSEKTSLLRNSLKRIPSAQSTLGNQLGQAAGGFSECSPFPPCPCVVTYNPHDGFIY